MKTTSAKSEASAKKEKVPAGPAKKSVGNETPSKSGPKPAASNKEVVDHKSKKSKGPAPAKSKADAEVTVDNFELSTDVSGEGSLNISIYAVKLNGFGYSFWVSFRWQVIDTFIHIVA